MSEYLIIERIPTVEEFTMLRNALGWISPDKDAASKALSNSLYSVCVEHDGKLIGTGRVIGDGGLYFYIQDVIVTPDYQERGIGKMIMDEIMKYLRNSCIQNSFVGLMSAKGKDGFYQKYGFAARPNETYGPGMFLLWHDECADTSYNREIPKSEST